MVALLKHGVADLKEMLADRHQQLDAGGHKRPMKTEGDTGCAGGRGREMWGRKKSTNIRWKRSRRKMRCSGRSSPTRAVSQTGVSRRIKTASANCGRPEVRSGPGRKESWRRCSYTGKHHNFRNVDKASRVWMWSLKDVRLLFSAESESGTDEEADGQEEFGESGRRLAQPFPPPLLCALVYCPITGKLNFCPLSTLHFYIEFLIQTFI